MNADPPILHVGDSALVEGHGRRKIEAIIVCLTPSTDPAGEERSVSVPQIELGEFGPSFIVHLSGKNWAYKGQVIAEGIEKGERDEG